MKPISSHLYKSPKCRCKEEFAITKKRKSTKLNEGRPFLYPTHHSETKLKTFQLKYDKPLSPIAKCLLNSFQDKYLYYAFDDILYLFKSSPTERDNLLELLYSPVLWLHNNLSIGFFNIWIDEIYIHESSKKNKFLGKNCRKIERTNYITMKLLYRPKAPVKKQEILW